jgi:hypothetical protein
MPFGGFGYSPYAGGCGNALTYGYYPTYYAFGGYASAAPPVGPAPIFPRPKTPIGAPIFHLPRNFGSGVVLHHPEGNPVPASGSSVGINAGQYRRPGLITEDAAGPRRPGELRQTNGDMTIESRRPNIQSMVGSGHIEEGLRGAGMRNGSSGDHGTVWRDTRGNSGGASNGSYRGVEGASRWNGGTRMSSGEGARSYGGQSGRSASGAQQVHSAPRGESGHASGYSSPRGGGETARSAPAHSEPARSAPAASSSGSKKP